MPRSVFWVFVAGTDITSTLEPILISLEITDGDGGKNDTLEVELDDTGGHIAFPPTSAPIQAGIMYEDDDGAPRGPPVQFSGKVDTCSSEITRGGGRTLRISAKSADAKGKPKEHQEKHHDKGKFSDVAQKWGKDAGLKVKVASGIDLEREYWSMQGESFLNWGCRVAEEIGATFKVRDGEAIFAERNSGQSAGGQALTPIRVHAEWDAQGNRIGNVIRGSMSPTDDRQTWEKFTARHYDPKQAKWLYEDVEAKAKGGSVRHLERHARATKDDARARGKANAGQSERDKGGGSITIDGEPAAMAECPVEVSGYRPGIDGSYKAKEVRHRLSRAAGFTTELELKAPGGTAGTDGRGSGKGASA